MSALTIDTQVQHCIKYEQGVLRIDNVILSYPHLDKRWSKTDPKTGKTPEPKYSGTFLMPKETHGEAFELIEQRIKELMNDPKNGKVGKKDWFLRDGDDTVKDGYADRWTVSASESKEVTIRDAKGNVMRDAKGNLFVEPADIERVFYPGAIVSVLIRPWFQNNDYGKKVNAGLVAVRFMEDCAEGERLGGDALDDTGAWDDAPEQGSASKTVRKPVTTALDDDEEEI